MHGLRAKHTNAAVATLLLGALTSCEEHAPARGTGQPTRSSAALSVAPVVRLTPESIGANATTWADAGESGVWFSAGAGSQAPKFVPVGLAGRPSVRFSSWQYMRGSLGDTAGWSGVSIAAVFKTVGVGPTGTVLGSGGAPGSANATAGVRWVAGVGLDPARGLGWAGTDGSLSLGGGGYDPNSHYVMMWKRSRATAQRAHPARVPPTRLLRR